GDTESLGGRERSETSGGGSELVDDVARDRYGRGRRGRRRVEHVDRARGAFDQEVVCQRAIRQDRLRPDTGGTWPQIVQGQLRAVLATLREIATFEQRVAQFSCAGAQMGPGHPPHAGESEDVE